MHASRIRVRTLLNIQVIVLPTLANFILSGECGFDVVNGMMQSGVVVPLGQMGDPITPMNWFFAILPGSVGQAVVWTFIQYGSMRLERPSWPACSC